MRGHCSGLRAMFARKQQTAGRMTEQENRNTPSSHDNNAMFGSAQQTLPIEKMIQILKLDGQLEPFTRKP